MKPAAVPYRSPYARERHRLALRFAVLVKACRFDEALVAQRAGLALLTPWDRAVKALSLYFVSMEDDANQQQGLALAAEVVRGIPDEVTFCDVLDEALDEIPDEATERMLLAIREGSFERDLAQQVGSPDGAIVLEILR